MKSSSRAFQICLIVAFTLYAQALAYGQRGGQPNTQPMTNSGKTSFGESGSISGRVTLPSGTPISGRVKITLSTTGNPGATGYTDSKGEFSFRNLREGIYYVEVEGDSSLYEVTREQARLTRPGNVFLTITLKEKKASRESSGMVGAAEVEQKVPSEAKKEFDKASKLVEEGKVAEAIERLQKAISIFPDYLMARNNLAAQYLKFN